MYSEAIYTSGYRKSAPHWLARLIANIGFSIVGVVGVALLMERSLRWPFRYSLRGVLLLFAVIGGVITLLPLERSLLTPKSQWGFIWSIEPSLRSYPKENLLKNCTAFVALVCALYATIALVSEAFKRLAGKAFSAADSDARMQ
ncbi:MAG TPA: hypothetical protein VHC22_12355 [Pirellulales bacterium]|nr:hypothetical protein [Pirellulales bacterium]